MESMLIESSAKLIVFFAAAVKVSLVIIADAAVFFAVWMALKAIEEIGWWIFTGQPAINFKNIFKNIKTKKQ